VASTLDALMDAAAAVLTAGWLEQTLRRVAERLAVGALNDLTLYEIDRAAGMFVPCVRTAATPRRGWSTGSRSLR
jgi:hypothetical protein